MRTQLNVRVRLRRSGDYFDITKFQGRRYPDVERTAEAASTKETANKRDPEPLLEPYMLHVSLFVTDTGPYVQGSAGRWGGLSSSLSPLSSIAQGTCYSYPGYLTRRRSPACTREKATRKATSKPPFILTRRRVRFRCARGPVGTSAGARALCRR